MTLFVTALLQATDSAAVSGGWTSQLRLGDPASLIRAAILLFVGLPAALLLSNWVRRWVAQQSNAQRGLVIGKLIWYVGLLTILMTTLSELGFSLAPLLGAAGILGIALGFASQTSVSNVISGFFLMAEQPFVVDDVIQIGPTTGRVLSIDMISVKLRTFDNRFVRIPNETIVKSEVTTITRFPIRRVDVELGVAYKEDVARVREVLLDVARLNPRCLMEPEPVIVFRGYGESSLDFLFGVWAAREHWLELKNSIHEGIKARFDAEGIEIPFPHRTLYVGSATDPFPVRVVRDGDEDAAPGSGDEDAVPGSGDGGRRRGEPRSDAPDAGLAPEGGGRP
jgi:small-conductance mechanosensitive channel